MDTTMNARIVVFVALGIACPMSSMAKPYSMQLSPEEYHPNKKPIGVFTDSHLTYSMGTYSTSLPIVLPRARNAHAPALSFDYRSDGQLTPFGDGWNIPLDHVRRSFRRGMPRYSLLSGSADDDEIEFRLGEHTGTLVFIRQEASGYLFYRPKIEGAFAKFYYVQSGDYWLVQDGTGKTWFLGEQGSKDTDGTRTFAWYVARIVDPFENLIKYEYELQFGSLYPKTIAYDLKLSSQTAHHPIVTFLYTTEVNPHNNVTNRKGWRAELDGRRFDGLDVTGYDEAGNVFKRHYTVTIQPVADAYPPNIATIQPDGLPEAQFSYYEPIAALAKGQSISVPQPLIYGGFGPYDGIEVRGLEVTNVETSNNGDAIYRTKSMLVDIDGDGWLDQLLFAPTQTGPQDAARYWWRRNVGWRFEDLPRAVSVPSRFGEALKYAKSSTPFFNLMQDVLDINGDSKADFVFVSQVGAIVACLGDGQGNFGVGGCSDWTASSGSIASTWFLATTYTHDFYSAAFDRAGLLDVNGDGLPDYLRPPVDQSSVLLVYLNRGMRPDGTAAGFAATPVTIPLGVIMPCIRAQKIPPSDSQVIMDFRDVNGDGLPDVLVKDKARSLVGFGVGPTDQLLNFEVFNSRTPILQSSILGGSPETYQTEMQDSGLYDADGDGRLDLITWHNESYSVQRNNGRSLQPATPFFVNNDGTQGYLFNGLSVRLSKTTGKDAKTIVLRQAVLDMDGDGRVEIVRGSDPEDGPYQSLAWYAVTADPAVGPANLLKNAISGPAATDIVYGHPDQKTVKTAYRNWVVNSLVEKDLATDEQRTKSITTRDPVYDHLKREFRGHAYAQVAEADGQRYQRYWYHTDEFKFGKEYRQETAKSATGDPVLRRVDTLWDELAFGGGGKWPRQQMVTTTISDAQGNSTTRVAYTYKSDETSQSFGLVDSIKQMGDINRPDTPRITTYQYYIRNNTSGTPSTSNFPLVKTQAETTTDSSGQIDASTSYKYDGMCSGQPYLTNGALCMTTVYRGIGEPDAQTTTVYDAHGRLIKRTDPDGSAMTTTYTYHDESGSLTPYVATVNNAASHVVTYSNYHPFSGEAQRICGPQHLDTILKCDEFSYDLYGRLLAVRRGLETQGTYAPLLVESYSYGDLTWPPSVTYTRVPDPLFGFNPVQDRTTYFNRWGQVVQEVKTRGTDWAVRRYVYDYLGQLQTAWLPYAQDTRAFRAPPPAGDRFVYGYDLIDRVTSSTHFSGAQAGDQLVITYRGNSTDVRDERSNLTTYGHNGFHEVITTSRQVGGQTQQSSFSYDSVGRLVGAIDEDNGSYSYVFYKDGSLKYATMPLGGSRTYLRYPSGRLASMIAPNSDTVSYAYDLLGRSITRWVDATGPCADTDAHRVDTFYYDEQDKNTGRLTSIDSNDYTKALDYDGVGNITFKQFQAKGGEWPPVLAIGIRPTPFGEPLRITYPSGLATSYHYAPSGDVDWVNDESDLFKVDVSRTPAGTPDVVSGYVKGAHRTDFQRQHLYDSKQRLAHVSSVISPADKVSWQWNIDHTYFENNSLKTVGDSYRFPGSGLAFTYDEANRLKTATGYSVGTISYTYNKNASLSTVVTNGSTEQYNYSSYPYNYFLDGITSSASKISISRDASGQWCSSGKKNSLGFGYARTYGWYGDGKLASVRHKTISLRPSEIVVRYSYDEEGKRWRTRRGTADTLHIDDLLELKNGQLTEYVSFPGGRVEIGPQAPYRVHFSDMMSTAVVIDDSGTAVHSTSHLPYGQRTQVAGVTDVPFDFNAKRREPTIGLIDFGARHYDPEVRQWMAPDPVRLTGTVDVLAQDGRLGAVLQPFVYAAANPVSKIDLLGLAPATISQAPPPPVMLGRMCMQNCTMVEHLSKQEIFERVYGPRMEEAQHRDMLEWGLSTGFVIAFTIATMMPAVPASSMSGKVGGERVPAAAAGRTAAGRGAGEALKDFSSVATRTTRGGGQGVRLTRPDGSAIDITANRVKEFVPNTHPSAPAGTLQRVKFPNAQPGTKGFKRNPTPDELRLLEEAFK